MRIVCRCEDVTYEDVVKAIREGCRDLETLKRKLRIGMGPCQGRTCLPIVLRILARETGKKVEEVALPTRRPPLKPVPLGLFSKGEKGEV